jgi:hypothetical protein
MISLRLIFFFLMGSDMRIGILQPGYLCRPAGRFDSIGMRPCRDGFDFAKVPPSRVEMVSMPAFFQSNHYRYDHGGADVALRGVTRV